MTGQMSIFDFIAPEIRDTEDLDDLTEAEMVQRISEATGLDFVKSKKWEEYEAKQGKAVFTVHYSRYNMTDNHNRFISVGWDLKTSGGGSPCDSLKEAIARIKKYIVRAAEEEQRFKETKSEKMVFEPE